MARIHILGLAVGLLAVGLLAGVATAQPQKMDLIISPEHAKQCGHDYSHASAWIWTWERWKGSGVLFRIRGAKPNHLHTIWLKLDGPSPLTGAGATPAVPIRGIPTLIDHANTASAAAANAFYTDRRGNAWVWIPLDFRLSQGVYPFSRYQSSLADVGIGNMPFTFRVISHCTDNVQHGLSPGVHEPTFQISFP